MNINDFDPDLKQCLVSLLEMEIERLSFCIPNMTSQLSSLEDTLYSFQQDFHYFNTRSNFFHYLSECDIDIDDKLLPLFNRYLESTVQSDSANLIECNNNIERVEDDIRSLQVTLECFKSRLEFYKSLYARIIDVAG